MKIDLSKFPTCPYHGQFVGRSCPLCTPDGATTRPVAVVSAPVAVQTQPKTQETTSFDATGNQTLTTDGKVIKGSGMPALQKATDQQIISSYNITKSVWKTGEQLGMCGQSIYERLKKLGVDTCDKWSEDELAQIHEAYRAGRVNLQLLSEALGRSKAAVACKADELGLTAQRGKHKRSAEACINNGKVASKRIKRNGHPRGMLGKKHTEEVKDRISKAGMGRVIKEEQIIKMLKTREKNGSMAPNHSGRKWKAAWREIGGRLIFARSRWEANYARYLEWLKVNKQIQEWEHEPQTFWFEKIKRGCRSYLPDFRVTSNESNVEYHEVKGWMDDRSKTKIKRMAKYHPSVRLLIFDSKWFKKNSRKLALIIPNWEG